MVVSRDNSLHASAVVRLCIGGEQSAGPRWLLCMCHVTCDTDSDLALHCVALDLSRRAGVRDVDIFDRAEGGVQVFVVVVVPEWGGVWD